MHIELNKTQLRTIENIINVYEDWVDSILIDIDVDDYDEEQEQLNDSLHILSDFYIKYVDDLDFDMTPEEFSILLFASNKYQEHLNTKTETANVQEKHQIELALENCDALQKFLVSFFSEVDGSTN